MKYEIIEKILENSLKTNKLFETYKYFKQLVKDDLKEGNKYMMITGFHKNRFLMFIFNVEKEAVLIYYLYNDKYKTPLFDLNSLPKINYLINKLKEKKDNVPINKKLYKDNDDIKIKLYKIN